MAGRIGVVLQESQPDPGLTVREAVELYAGYYADPRHVDETLALVGLDDERDAMLATALSGGQRRRLDVALALVGRPELLFLDEPTTGFDPAARRLAWKMIEGLRATGTTVFLTTHAMDEAACLADRIAVIADGRIIASGTAGHDRRPRDAREHDLVHAAARRRDRAIFLRRLREEPRSVRTGRSACRRRRRCLPSSCWPGGPGRPALSRSRSKSASHRWRTSISRSPTRTGHAMTRSPLRARRSSGALRRARVPPQPAGRASARSRCP